jgi:hypothetical protein
MTPRSRAFLCRKRLILDALRQRFADAGLTLDEDTLRGHAGRIAGLDPNTFSKK